MPITGTPFFTAASMVESSLLEERIAVDLVDADRAAEHDEEIGVLGGTEIVDAGFEIAERDAAILQHAFQGAGILEGDMAYGDGVLHRLPSSAPAQARILRREARPQLTISDA